MNGPEHYRESENSLRYAWSGEASDPELTIATAQVHATLALAAAQIEDLRPGWVEILEGGES
jgi:hypothetical protein